MFNIYAIENYKVNITTKLQYEEMVDYYCDTGAITETRKETVRKQKIMEGGELMELIADYLRNKDCFEVVQRKDNELIITFYDPYDTTSETIKKIRWEVKKQ